MKQTINVGRKATVSQCGRYRYALWRDWSKDYEKVVNGLFDPHPQFYPGKRDTYVNFVMLNPSVADAQQDDPTIRRCTSFAQSWAFGSMCVTNLFAYRSTDPRKLKQVDEAEAIGPENDKWLKRIALGAGLVVAAWGPKGSLGLRDEYVKRLLWPVELKHIGELTVDGFPRHPLMLHHLSQLRSFY